MIIRVGLRGRAAVVRSMIEARDLEITPSERGK